MYQGKMTLKLPVKPTDLVLEIGSGHNPHPRSDILADRELKDDTERQRQRLRIDRPLVIADGQRLPFQDTSFDFVYCAQVLEHTQDPLQFVRELGRVSKKGLIVVPRITRERLFGWPYHRWYFWQDKGRVWFAPKKPGETLPHAALTHRLFAKTLWFRRQISALEKELNLYYWWSGLPRLAKASEREKARQLTQADAQVREILDGLEFNKQKDVVFWCRWLGERFSNKVKKLARQLTR
jgi:ubiquinone/menaquinone biosynthesis C-methylase UbiE